MIMNQRNYQKELEKLIAKLPGSGEMEQGGQAPSLLLHSCCAPCSSYVLEYLSRYFSITVFYYNPNITAPEEYRKRVEEQRRLILELPVKHPVSFVEGDYEPQAFTEIARGLEQAPEGGERCFRCYALRLEKTARLAAEKGYDYFTTTLTISPLKNAQKLNEIGEQMAKRYGCRFLNSDFKKRNGYKRSTELSREYHLYRQDYCGCIYSKQERDRRVQEQAEKQAGKEKE